MMRCSTCLNWLIPVAVLICWIVISLPPAAAAEPGEPTANELEVVNITAQGRSESLQSVPIALTALTATEVERKGIHGLGTLASTVPGLTFSPFAPGQNIISLRGVSSNDDGAGTDNSVAVFIDDVYLGRVSNSNPELFDVERVEVLRGPQGTLYGKNTVGGAINILSSRPNSRELEVKTDASFGNYQRHNFSTLLTGPLTPAWAGKIAVSTRASDGWVDNVQLHTREKNDNSQSVRGQLLRETGGSQLLLSADYQQLRDEDAARTPLTHMTNNLPFDPLAAHEAQCGANNPACATNPYDGYARQFSYGVSAKFTGHASATDDVVSISAFRRSYNQWSQDAFGAVLPFGNAVWDNTTQYSEELRWVAARSEWLNYVAGLWFMREDTNRLRLFLLPSVDPDADHSDRYRGINRTISYAGFGQADWRISAFWTLTVGVRFSHDFKHIDNDAVHGQSGIFDIIPVTFANARAAGWSKFTPKVALRYQPAESVNFYATVAEGFKSGGFAASPTSVADTEPLRPEQALNIELGTKIDLVERLRANLAIFDTYYKDLQIQSFGPRADCVSTATHICFGEFETFNAGSAQARGAELELIWLPFTALTLSASLGYLDAKFKHLFLPNASVYTTLDGRTIDLRNQSGQTMIRAPRNKGNLEVLYRVPIRDGGKLAISADYSYTADQRGELEPYATQPAYCLIDGRVSWASPQREYEISLWGRNLANRTWVAHVATIANEVFAVYGDTRTYGLTFSWHFAGNPTGRK